MKTIMQRWAQVKKDLLAECDRLKACRDEAKAIITETTGQQPVYFDIQKGDVNIHECSDFVAPIRTFSTARGNFPAPDRHWPESLKKYETILKDSRTITTGDFISAWEKSQE